MVIALLLALSAAPGAQSDWSPGTESPVRVRVLSFDPVDLSVTYNQAVDHGVTAYTTRIVWRFADGTTTVDTIALDWFVGPAAFSEAGLGGVINPLSMQTLVPSTMSRPAYYTRKPKNIPVPLMALVGVDITVLAAIRVDATAYGNEQILNAIFTRRRALKTEYDHWARVIAGVWQDDSPIAALRMIAPELEQPRRSALGESLRLAIKKTAEFLLFEGERDLAAAPRLLQDLIERVEQQQTLLTAQSNRADR